MALPNVKYNFAGGKKEVAEIVSGIGQAIFSQARVSFESAAKAVVPDVPKMIQEITDDLSAGPLNRFSEGLRKVDTLVDKLGVNLGDYSKELAEFLKLRQEKSIVSEETVNQLRTQNIKAQVNEFGEVVIMTRTQIEEQQTLLKEQNKEIKNSQKVIEDYSKIQKKGGTLTEEQNQELIDANNNVIKTTEQRADTMASLNMSEAEDTRTFREKAGDAIQEYVPDGLIDIGSAFTEGLMAPFTAIKDLGMMFGNLLKPLKMLPKLLKGFTVGLLGALMAMLPYLLIVGAVVVAIMGLMKILDHFGIGLDDIIGGLVNFKDFILELPGKIADGFKSIFTKLQNFFIDAINGVISLINKIPGINIEKLDRKELPKEETAYDQVQMAAPGAKDYDMTSATEQQDNAFGEVPTQISATEQKDNAFIVPTTPDKGMSFMERMKTSPANNEYLPVETQAATGGNTIIDNSVKTATSNNQTQSIGISSRNDDTTLYRTSDIAV